ncbi:kinase-like domain-containing protein [Russula brevipes]|nr:kinase-like domain-containing protein [Russula brevipes]
MSMYQDAQYYCIFALTFLLSVPGIVVRADEISNADKDKWQDSYDHYRTKDGGMVVVAKPLEQPLDRNPAFEDYLHVAVACSLAVLLAAVLGLLIHHYGLTLPSLIRSERSNSSRRPPPARDAENHPRPKENLNLGGLGFEFDGSSEKDSHRSDPEEFYVKQDRIGKGSFGEVFKGYDKRTQKTVAIKIIDLESAEDEIEDIQQEIQILSQLDSPHVTKFVFPLHRLWPKRLVMEYFHPIGNLLQPFDCLLQMKPGVFREEYIAIIIRELLRGLDYLHTEGKLHRDIKAANILLSAGGEVKLADFGVSGQLSGTLSAKKNTFVLFLIPKNPPPQLDSMFSKTFREFVSYCLQRDPRDRPSARELLKHKFIRMAKKTSYLTELIERHERWKAEGGDRLEEDIQDRNEDLSTTTDPEDLWDFGTVRTTARPGTIGRASGVPTTGPPLTWDYNNTSRSRASSGSGASIASTNGPRRGSSTEVDTTVASSITAKADRLPPLPSSDRGSSRRIDQQATIRHGPIGSNEGNGVRREPSDEYDDLEDHPPEDDLPDTTMLDSVVLPAIASLFPRVSTQEARVALSTLQRAFTEAERTIPGVTLELVNEIVDSVEHVEDGR